MKDVRKFSDDEMAVHLKLVKDIIAFSFKENLSKVKSVIDMKIIAFVVDDANDFDVKLVEYSLGLYRENNSFFSNIKGILRKVGNSHADSIIGLTKPKVLEVEFAELLKTKFYSFRNMDTNLNVDCDTIQLQAYAKEQPFKIWSVVKAKKMKLSPEIMHLLNSMEEFDKSKSDYESQRVKRPMPPKYEKPVYEGAFYLSGTYIGPFYERGLLGTSILLQSGGKYYVISGAQDPRNPAARYLSGYVIGNSQIMIDRGRNGTPATKVSISDVETYQEDQVIYAQKLKTSQEEFAQDQQNYIESMRRYNDAVVKNIGLKKECDEKARTMIISFHSLM
jgi:hypothetical protein